MQLKSTSAEIGRPQRRRQSPSAATPLSSVGQADTHASQLEQVVSWLHALALTLQRPSAHWKQTFSENGSPGSLPDSLPGSLGGGTTVQAESATSPLARRPILRRLLRITRED